MEIWLGITGTPIKIIRHLVKLCINPNCCCSSDYWLNPSFLSLCWLCFRAHVGPEAVPPFCAFWISKGRCVCLSEHRSLVGTVHPGEIMLKLNRKWKTAEKRWEKARHRAKAAKRSPEVDEDSPYFGASMVVWRTKRKLVPDLCNAYQYISMSLPGSFTSTEAPKQLRNASSCIQAC